VDRQWNKTVLEKEDAGFRPRRSSALPVIGPGVGQSPWSILLKTAAAQQELHPTGDAPVDGVGRASLPASRIPGEERFFSGSAVEI
jgi:hypothetical protein